MIIPAKYASECSSCGKKIEIGAKIEWARGQKARHVACAPSIVPSVKTCRSCGTVEIRNSRGYVDGSPVHNGECRDCREEREMGY